MDCAQAIDSKKLCVQTDSDLFMDAGKRQRLTAILAAFDARWIVLAVSARTPPSTITADVIKRDGPSRLVEKVRDIAAIGCPVLLMPEQYILGYSRRDNTWEKATITEHNKATV